MNRCATCKHWTPVNSWNANAAGLRKCVAVRQRWDVEDEVPEVVREGREYEWEENDLSSRYKQAAESVFGRAKAVVNDGSQYIAELLTRHDFGCVLHEPD